MSGRAFAFSVDGASAITVVGGGCSGPMSVTSGSHRIVEAPTAGLQVKAIRANHLVSKDLSSATVVVTVQAGSTAANATMVSYTNAPEPAAGLQVCNQTPSPSFVGDKSSFTENSGRSFRVVAGTVGTPVCGPVHAYRLGKNVNVAELATPYTLVSAITMSDRRGSNVNKPAGTVTATIGHGVTVVTYTTEIHGVTQTGYVEICATAGDTGVTGSFELSITDATGLVSTQAVPVGQCSAANAVAAGNVTVTETELNPYVVSAIAVSPVGRLISENLTQQTVTVTVPSGDSSTESIVTFQNSTSPA